MLYQNIMKNLSVIRNMDRLFLTTNPKRHYSPIKENKTGTKIDIDGTKINYVSVGKGDHPILCLPGALGSAWTDFKPQLEGLDRNLFTIVAWDPPGYGHSRPPNRDFSEGFFHRDADIACKLMKALNLPRFSLLGWSDGGITAIILAAKYPHLIKKVAIWGANAYVIHEDAEIYKKVRDISSWSEKMRAPMIELYGEEYFRATWEAWVDALLDIYERDGNICGKELRKLERPVFLLHGAKDPMVSGIHTTVIKGTVPNCRVHIFPEGKHNIHLRYAEEFNKLVTEFLINGGPSEQLHDKVQ